MKPVSSSTLFWDQGLLLDLLAAGIALLLSLFFFSPRWLVFTRPLPGTFEWSRGLTFQQQCADPLRADVSSDPAMTWRLLPPLVCHYIGLTGTRAFLFPWLGVVCLLTQTAQIVRQRTGSWCTSVLGACLVATTSAVCIPTGWLGINDAWYLMGLVAFAFGRSVWSIVLPCLLAPWIDERFILGLPIAFVCRYELARFEETYPRLLWWGIVTLGSLVPYAGARLLFRIESDRTGQFLNPTVLKGVMVYLPHVHLGWWMGLRAGWIFVLLAGYQVYRTSSRLSGLVETVMIFAPLAALTVLAAYTSRNIAVLLPVVLLGIVLSVETGVPSFSLATAVVINCALPLLHVTYTKNTIVSPLPLELFRLFWSKLPDGS